MSRRENDREIEKRRRRVLYVRKLKGLLAETKDVKTRERLIEKIRKRSLRPENDLKGL